MDFNYAELLKNPLWQQKRKRIISRDGGKCTVCGAKSRLEVHHTFYYKDYPAPWGYPDESLLTVCESCHHQWHEYNENVIKDRPKVIKKKRKVKLKIKVNRKNKPKKKKGYLGHKKLCLAVIQANRKSYRKLENGDWVHKNYVEESPKEKLKRLKKS